MACCALLVDGCRPAPSQERPTAPESCNRRGSAADDGQCDCAGLDGGCPVGHDHGHHTHITTDILAIPLNLGGALRTLSAELTSAFLPTMGPVARDGEREILPDRADHRGAPSGERHRCQSLAADDRRTAIPMFHRSSSRSTTNVPGCGGPGASHRFLYPVHVDRRGSSADRLRAARPPPVRLALTISSADPGG